MQKKGLSKKAKQTISDTVKGIIITKKEGANKDIMKDLYQLRYGKDWNKYYSS